MATSNSTASPSLQDVANKCAQDCANPNRPWYLGTVYRNYPAGSAEIQAIDHVYDTVYKPSRIPRVWIISDAFPGLMNDARFMNKVLLDRSDRVGNRVLKCHPAFHLVTEDTLLSYAIHYFTSGNESLFRYIKSRPKWPLIVYMVLNMLTSDERNAYFSEQAKVPLPNWHEMASNDIFPKVFGKIRPGVKAQLTRPTDNRHIEVAGPNSILMRKACLRGCYAGNAYPTVEIQLDVVFSWSDSESVNSEIATAVVPNSIAYRPIGKKVPPGFFNPAAGQIQIQAPTPAAVASQPTNPPLAVPQTAGPPVNNIAIIPKSFRCHEDLGGGDENASTGPTTSHLPSARQSNGSDGEVCVECRKLVPEGEIMAVCGCSHQRIFCSDCFTALVLEQTCPTNQKFHPDRWYTQRGEVWCPFATEDNAVPFSDEVIERVAPSAVSAYVTSKAMVAKSIPPRSEPKITLRRVINVTDKFCEMTPALSNIAKCAGVCAVHGRMPKPKRVWAIEAPSLWHRYMATMESIELYNRPSGKSEPLEKPSFLSRLQTMQVGPPLNEKVNEALLWHGTKVVNAAGILQNGIDSRLSVTALYGKGSYFTDALCKSLQYTDKQRRIVLVCRVVLGKWYQVDKHSDVMHMNRPPNVPNSTRIYDSVVAVANVTTRENNIKQLHNEYIVHTPMHSYPQFMIEW